MNIIFLFIDGVGLGQGNNSNPFTQKRYDAFEFICGGQPFLIDAENIEEANHYFAPVDANLGVAGLPQSGTGQTALFTGKNAAKEIGKHFGPWPHSGIKHLLKDESIFYKTQKREKSCQFINAYPEVFFKNKKKTNRWSSTTLMAKNAGLPLNGTQQVKRKEAVTAGLTQRAWKEQLNIDVPVISPQTAARRLLKRSQIYDLLLHEYYLTDKAGHSQSEEKAEKYLEIYNDFLKTVINEKPDDALIVLSSDHGNIEDLSTKSHTRNSVPLFVYGKGAKKFNRVQSILDITPGIIQLFE